MESEICKSLNSKRERILSKWQPIVHGSYAVGDFLTAQKAGNRFSHPMAYAIEKNTAEILDWLLKVENNVDIDTPLEEICRHKALQDVRPSEALSFIFDLKQIIREELRDEYQAHCLAGALMDIDKRIDEVGLRAFDIFLDCRTRICEIKMNEIKRMYGRVSG